MEITKRFVQVQNIKYIDHELPRNPIGGREFEIRDTDIAIYDTNNWPYYKFEGRLWISKNLDSGEFLHRGIFECLGTIVAEHDTLEEAKQ